jgi:hypothetical protein
MSALAKQPGPVAEALWLVDQEFGDVTLAARIGVAPRDEARAEPAPAGTPEAGNAA